MGFFSPPNLKNPYDQTDLPAAPQTFVNQWQDPQPWVPTPDSPGPVAVDPNGDPTQWMTHPGLTGQAAIDDSNARLAALLGNQNQGGGGNGGGGGDQGGGGGGGGYSSAGFQFPQFNPPAWQSVTPFAAPAPFSYQDFTAPTIEQARNEPGFAFALDEGQKALQNSAAAKGTLRSGGAEKGLASWTNQFADQNYGNVFNRASQVYNTNRGNAAENYLTNYGISRDVWDRNTGQQNLANNYNFNAAAAQFNPQFQASQLQFADLFNRAQLGQQNNQFQLGTLAQLAGYGAQ